jgi:hypothetical protein
MPALLGNDGQLASPSPIRPGLGARDRPHTLAHEPTSSEGISVRR